MTAKSLLALLAAGVMTAPTASFASVVLLGSLTQFDGGDAGEGLDLSGDIVYAFNLGGTTTAQTVQGVTFTNASLSSLPTGITTTAANQFNYGATFDYGTTADDNALQSILSRVWYDTGSFSLDLAVETGKEYKLQLLFQEGYINANGSGQGASGSTIKGRKDDILLEGTLGLDDFEMGIETNGAAQAGPDFGKVYTYQFTATDNLFTVLLDSETGSAEVPILGAVTLEAIPEPASLALIGLGGLLIAKRRRD